MARFPNALNEVKVEMYCDSSADPGLKWRDITSSVRWEDRIQIRHGRPDESSEAPPASCVFAVNDPANIYGRRNPASPYYGLIGLGTPLRVRVTTAKDTFSTTASSSWGTPTISNDTWFLTGLGGFSNADFNKGSGVGTVRIPAATNIRYCSSSGTDNMEDADVQVTWSMAVAITGAEAHPGNVFVHGYNYTADLTYARVAVQTDNSIQIGLRTAGGSTLAAQTTVPGLIYVPGTDYTTRIVCHGTFVAAKVWKASDPEPLAWQVSAYNTGWVRGNPGAVGIRTATGTGNTNANLTVTYKNYYARSDRFSGEIASMTPGRDTTGNFQYVSIEAAGLLRRLSQGDAPIQSAMRRGTPSTTDLLAYWPLEEGEAASQFTAATANTNPLQIQSDTAIPKYASNSEFLSSAPLPAFNAAFFGAVLPDYNPNINGSTQLRFLLKIPSTGAVTNSVIARLWGDGTARLWQILYTTGGNLVIEAYNRSVVNILSSSSAFAVDGDLLRVSMDLDQVGADINWVLSVYQVGSAAAQTASGTLAGRTIGKSTYVDFNPFATLTDTVIGHITVQTGLSSVSDLNLQLNGYDGELAQTRLVRLINENDVDFLDLAWTGTAAMGPQTVDGLLPLLRECGNTDMGSFFDSRALDTARLEYRSLKSAYNQNPILTVDLSLGQVAPPWAPVDDDQQTRNDVTANNKVGGSYQYVLDGGPMSVLPATQGGIGRYDTIYEVNAASDAQLPDIASWQVALGSQDEYRFPILTVNLGNPDTVTAGLQNAILSANVDDLVQTRNADSSHVYDDIDQIVRGYGETISSTEHVIAFNCTTGTPYTVGALDPNGAAAYYRTITYLDAESTVLSEAISSSIATLRVRSDTERWSSTVPYPIVIGGERMTVTACENISTTLVGNGAFTHGNNASLTPALPAGHALNDVLLIFAAIRNSGTGTVNTPTGYTLLKSNAAGNARIFGKFDNGTESTPTVTFTGGVANATTSAVMSCLRYTSLSVFNSGTQANASAQDIAASPIAAPMGGGAAMVQMIWKQDDWTSVSTDTLVVFESSSTTGDDQGIAFTLEYTDGFGGNGAHPGQTFTVTGGASAVSSHLAVSLYGTQKMTVTRSVNGVVKSHPAGASVHVGNPTRLAL